MTAESRPQAPPLIAEILEKINEEGVPEESDASRFKANELEEFRESFEMDGCFFLSVNLYFDPEKESSRLYLRYEDDSQFDDTGLEETQGDLIEAQLTWPGVKIPEKDTSLQIVLGAQVANALKIPFRIEQIPDHIVLECSLKENRIAVDSVIKLRYM